jgi:F-type H+-transporting ATPase subunit c
LTHRPGVPRSLHELTHDGSFEEAFDVSTRSILTATLALVAFGFVSPLYAQGAGATEAGNTLIQWSIITGGFALAFAAAFGALAQGKGVSAAVEAIARNPSAANDIRGNLILGLVLIESLVIYVLLIALILFFVKPFGG